MSAPCPVFGFVLTIRVHESMSDTDADAFMVELIRFLEANGLTAHGTAARIIELVISRDGSQATDADRELVVEWLSRRANVGTQEVSDLIDLSQMG
jgi:uncharacterized protein YggL (DUF469 family)